MDAVFVKGMSYRYSVPVRFYSFWLELPGLLVLQPPQLPIPARLPLGSALDDNPGMVHSVHTHARPPVPITAFSRAPPGANHSFLTCSPSFEFVRIDSLLTIFYFWMSREPETSSLNAL